MNFGSYYGSKGIQFNGYTNLLSWLFLYSVGSSCQVILDYWIFLIVFQRYLYVPNNSGICACVNHTDRYNYIQIIKISRFGRKIGNSDFSLCLIFYQIWVFVYSNWLYLAPLWRGGRGCVISPPYNHHNQSHLTITGSFAVCFSWRCTSCFSLLASATFLLDRKL